MGAAYPAKFDELPNLDPEVVMVMLAKAGYINEDIADSFGMSMGQFNRLLRINPDLKDKLDAAKNDPNSKVEGALFKRALGYKIQEVVKENGKPIKVVLKEIAPDPVSCIFWLKNRDPKRWRDVLEHKFTLRDRMDRAHDAISSPRTKELKE
jgi:hypothetical protein